VRFLPQQTRPARLILIGYAVSCGLALVLGSGAMFLMPRVSDELVGLGFDSGLGWLWIASLALWGIFCLQDAALTGLRQAPWIPVENTAFGLAKLLCLPLFLAVGVTNGIFLAWVLPMALLLIPVNAIVFRRATPRHKPAAREEGEPGLRSPELRRYLLLDYTAATFIQGLYTVLPLLVLAILGSGNNAYFWIPFSLVTAIDMMSLSVATSMTVEGAYARSELAQLARTAVRRFAVIVLGAAAVLSIAAPLVLAPFGSEYVARGSGPLRVLAIGVVCHGVIELFVGLARVRRHGRSLALLGIARCVLALLFCGLLGARFGVMGVAVGWSLMSVIVALAVLPSVLRVLAVDGTHGSRPIRHATVRARAVAGRVWSRSGPYERIALVSSAGGLIATSGVLPAVPAFLLLLGFVMTAPGAVALVLVWRLGTPPETTIGVVAGIGLGVLVLLAQSMLWLGAWYTRGWLGLLAIACLAILATRALSRPLWPAGGLVDLMARLRRVVPFASRTDVEGNR
jgi:O-antigen/teichoic acid export membrane protein